MADNPPLKNIVNNEVVAALAAGLARVADGFDQESFLTAATTGLAALELKERVRHIAAAAAEHLPRSFPVTARLIRAAIESPGDDVPAIPAIACWPLNQVVQEHGLDHLEESMATMEELTKQMSSEFAIRPFLDRYPEQSMTWLERWVEHDDHRVRRLVSEGTRPRLPWASRLQGFIRPDPLLMLPLLERLRDDPSEHVRRSVANHLNDLAKDHADRVVSILEQWSVDAPANRTRLIKHALRTLVKQGHPGALAILGFGEAEVTAEIQVSPRVLELGEAITIAVELASEADQDQELLIDYAVHHQRSRGTLSRKVFKWTRRTISPGERISLQRRHPLVPISTRRYYSGEHRVELLVNGSSRGTVAFDLRCP